MKRNKSIALCIDTFHPGGAERVCINFANQLLAMGYEVKIFAFNSKQSFYLEELNDEIKVIYLDTSGTLDTFLKVLSEDVFKDSDSIIAFNHQISLLLYFSKSIKRYKWKLISRNVNNLRSNLNDRNHNFRSFLLKSLMNKFYPKMDYYISQCEEMKLDMSLFYGIDKNKIIVINNPVSDKFKHKKLEKEFDIIFVGRFKPQKGIDKLIRILNEVSRHKDIKVKVVGRGELKDEFLSSINHDRVKLDYSSSSNDLPDLFNRSKVTILTSNYEGYPNVLNESLACCTPVISFDCKSGPRDIIVDNENGFLIRDFNTLDFSRKILSILNDEVTLNPKIINFTNFENITRIL